MQWSAQRPIHFSLLMHVQVNVVVVSPLARVVKGNKMANLAAIKTPFNLFTPQVSVPCCIVFYSVRCNIKQTDRQTDLCTCVPRFAKNYMKILFMLLSHLVLPSCYDEAGSLIEFCYIAEKVVTILNTDSKTFSNMFFCTL